MTRVDRLLDERQQAVHRDDWARVEAIDAALVRLTEHERAVPTGMERRG